MKYRKKPVIIEAFQWNPDISADDAPGWFLQAYFEGVVSMNDDGALNIRTMEGDHRCDIGDFVIRGVKGELYPCKPDIFELTYEAV